MKVTQITKLFASLIEHVKFSFYVVGLLESKSLKKRYLHS